VAPRIAYLADGKVHLKLGDAPPRIVESPFIDSVRSREASIVQRNAWKSEGATALVAGRLGGGTEEPGGTFAAITGLSQGRVPGELLYSIQTSAVTGLFALDSATGEEKRLFHANQYRLEAASTRPGLDVVACSLPQDAFGSHIGVMRSDGSALSQVTDGDSVDAAPSWTPDAPSRLVYQSAGVARDAAGRVVAVGPSAIHELDLDRREVRTLAESPQHDLLSPRVADDGALYYIRRPWPARSRIGPLRLLLDLLLLPFRLLAAIFSWLNVFTVRYSGRPLVGAPGAPPHRLDARSHLVGDGSAIRPLWGARDGGVTTPSSWQLVRQPPGGAPVVVARGVCAFDLTPTGVLYSTGSEIHHRAGDGTDERLCTGSRIVQVIALG
jgi:hypothetical protein